MKKSIKTFIFFFFLITIFSSLQLNSQSNDGTLNLQLVVNFGYPVTSIGANVIYQQNPLSGWQAAVGYGIRYNYRNYGPREAHLEHNLFVSNYYQWGEKEIADHDQLLVLKHIDGFNSLNSVGYTWERFYNKLGTSQNVGTVSFRFDRVVTLLSNDVLANTKGKDRYRTGAFSVGYRDGDQFLTTSVLLWTGNTHCGKKIRDTDYPARWGYKDISDCNNGDLSHGVWSINFYQGLNYGNSISLALGTDSERVRNVIQNKVFHDMYFVPDAFHTTENMHIPMKTEDGENYLFLEEQSIRANRFVWNLGLNSAVIY